MNSCSPPKPRDQLVAGRRGTGGTCCPAPCRSRAPATSRDQALDRRLRRERDERGRADVAVGGAQDPGARARAGSRAWIVSGGIDRPCDMLERGARHARRRRRATSGYPLLFVLIAVEIDGRAGARRDRADRRRDPRQPTGSSPIEAVIAVAAAAAIVGDNIGYLIGRKAGRAAARAPGPFERHRRAVLAVGEPFFDRHGPEGRLPRALGPRACGSRAAWLAGVERACAGRRSCSGTRSAASSGRRRSALLAYCLGHAAEQRDRDRRPRRARRRGRRSAVGICVVLLHRRHRRRAGGEATTGALAAVTGSGTPRRRRAQPARLAARGPLRLAGDPRSSRGVADLDRDLAGLALLGLGDPHLEHALVERRRSRPRRRCPRGGSASG